MKFVIETADGNYVIEGKGTGYNITLGQNDPVFVEEVDFDTLTRCAMMIDEEREREEYAEMMAMNEANGQTNQET